MKVILYKSRYFSDEQIPRQKYAWDTWQTLRDGAFLKMGLHGKWEKGLDDICYITTYDG